MRKAMRCNHKATFVFVSQGFLKTYPIYSMDLLSLLDLDKIEVKNHKFSGQ